MKTLSKLVFKKDYYSSSKWGKQVHTYIEIKVHFDFKGGLRYSVAVPNFSCCDRSLKNAFIRVLEHESIGMYKYESLKEIITKKSLWNSIS